MREVRPRTKRSCLVACLWLIAAVGLACGAQPTLRSPRAQISTMAPKGEVALEERQAALGRAGVIESGRRVYETCSSCHLPNGTGARDGTMPQLAGQHASVLIKQLTDMRANVRVNPIMYPYARELSGPSEIADVAAYLQSLPTPSDNGKGPAMDLERGRQLYERDCARCHGERGEGNAQLFYPVLAGQHYRYIVRQIIDIAGGRRGNANPEMAGVVAGYLARDVSLVSDYASRLPGRPPGH